MTDDSQICCPEFDPKPWDRKEIEWRDKKFVKARVFTLFYMPINFGQVIMKLLKKAEEKGVKFVGNLCLSDHTSKWNMDIYVAADKELEGYENVTMTGTFLTKVYEGDFKETGKWCEDFAKFVKSRGKIMKKMYMCYTTCPACAKKYGRNYVVIFGEV